MTITPRRNGCESVPHYTMPFVEREPLRPQLYRR